jgi:hypothetical protein
VQATEDDRQEHPSRIDESQSGSTSADLAERVRKLESDEREASKARRWERWEPQIDVVIVALLAFSSLAAAWSGYQSALWDGRQSSRYSQASARRIDSSNMSTYAHQLTIVDIITFTNYMDAYAQGDTELINFYVARFRADFKPAFEAWIATNPLTNPDAPTTPFVMPEYSLPQANQANQLRDEAETLFNQGEKDNRTGDRYVLNTVFLAIVLFFAGIAPRVTWIPARVGLLSVATGLLLYGLFNLLTFPLAS